MIELYKWKQFAEFAKVGTLLKAAENLHLSQPALSRNMNALEEDLGIRIFNRRKNKLELNENGRYVAGLVNRLLEEAETLPMQAREFARRQTTIAMGVCAPAPIWLLAPLIARIFPRMTLSTEIAAPDRLLSELRQHVYQLVATHQKPTDSDLYFKECGKECLKFAPPKHHRLQNKKQISFADIDGENFLIFHEIGFWNLVREKLPASRFLTQNDAFSFDELIRSSTLPYFTTDLAEMYLQRKDGRVHIPITDKEAIATYYLVCLSEQKDLFQPLFQSLA